MVLIPTDDEPEEDKLGDELPEDHDTPFSPPDPSSLALDGGSFVDDNTTGPTLSDTHPSTDTELEAGEVYDEGLAGAAEAEEANASSSVVDYDPDKDASEEEPG